MLGTQRCTDLCAAEASGKVERQKLLSPRAPVPLQPRQASGMSIWALNLTVTPLRGGEPVVAEGLLRHERYSLEPCWAGAQSPRGAWGGSPSRRGSLGRA